MSIMYEPVKAEPKRPRNHAAAKAVRSCSGSSSGELGLLIRLVSGMVLGGAGVRAERGSGSTSANLGTSADRFGAVPPLVLLVHDGVSSGGSWVTPWAHARILPITCTAGVRRRLVGGDVSIFHTFAAHQGTNGALDRRVLSRAVLACVTTNF